MYNLTTTLLLHSLAFYPNNAQYFTVAAKSTPGASYEKEEHQTLMHGVTFKKPVSIDEYYVSEKLDGVRAYWDGKYLWSRSGLLISAPKRILELLPSIPLDGELWMGRGKFEEVSGLINSNNPADERWSELSFAVFDIPYLKGTFQQRYKVLKQILPSPSTVSPMPPVFVIPQLRVIDEQDLLATFERVVENEGEGLMLHRMSNQYYFGRTNNILKLKQKNYMTATVVGYKPGNGKYTDLVGSLKLKAKDGEEFYVGSGLTDKLRSTPPKIGSNICVAHSGFTAKGKPRFPRYANICNDD